MGGLKDRPGFYEEKFVESFTIIDDEEEL